MLPEPDQRQQQKQDGVELVVPALGNITINFNILPI